MAQTQTSCALHPGLELNSKCPTWLRQLEYTGVAGGRASIIGALDGCLQMGTCKPTRSWLAKIQPTSSKPRHSVPEVLCAGCCNLHTEQRPEVPDLSRWKAEAVQVRSVDGPAELAGGGRLQPQCWARVRCRISFDTRPCFLPRLGQRASDTSDTMPKLRLRRRDGGGPRVQRNLHITYLFRYDCIECKHAVSRWRCTDI